MYIGDRYDYRICFVELRISNYGKLMQYINAKSVLKMNIQFGTIRDFFDYIPKVESK